MRKYLVWAGAAAISAFFGCGQSGTDAQGSETVVRGTVTSTSVPRDNARAIAIADDNTMYWSYLDNKGDFTLKLPVGQSYRIVFANQLETGGQQKIGHLAITTSDGVSEWFGANEPGVVDLGKVSVIKDNAGGGLTPSCYSCSTGTSGGWSGGGDDDADKDDDRDDDKDDDADEDREHSDDHECTKDDSKSSKSGKSGGGKGGEDDDDDDKGDKGGKGGADHKKCDVCKNGGEKDDELKPSKNPGDKCADKYKDKHPKERDDDKGCKQGKGGDADKGGKGGDDKSGDDKSGDYSDKEGDKDGEGGKGGSGDSGGDGGGKGGKGGKASGSGTGDKGSSCNTSGSCTSTCSCVATKCEAY